MRWKEFFTDKDNEDPDQTWVPPVFPKEKSNLPPKGGKPLSDFLTGVRNELLGTKLNRIRPNVPKEELEALNELTKLQKECKIIIKPCDKGAGIIVCDFEKYVKACELI